MSTTVIPFVYPDPARDMLEFYGQITPQPQAKNPSHGTDNDEYSVDIVYSASTDRLAVFFKHTKRYTHEDVEDFIKSYPVINNVMTPVVSQKMFHDIVDWTQHHIQPMME